MTSQETPDLHIPFTKPRHVGYCLCCYRADGPIYSIPLATSTENLLEILKRRNVINGKALTKREFTAVFPHLVGAAELCWRDDLEFVIEGRDLPLGWVDHR